MSTVTAPKGGIPIGYVQQGIQRIPVMIDSEWLRYLSQDLFVRVGGTNGLGTAELTLSQFEDAGIAEGHAIMFAAHDELRQIPPAAATAHDDSQENVGELRAQLAALARRVSDLEEGTVQ